jgi:hypothetical protein
MDPCPQRPKIEAPPFISTVGLGRGRRSRVGEKPKTKGEMKQLGMDSDVSKSELSVFVSAKNTNMDIRTRIRF